MKRIPAEGPSYGNFDQPRIALPVRAGLLWRACLHWSPGRGGGKPGVIAEDRGHYIGVNFDADRPGVIRNAHPVSDVTYLGMGHVRPISRSQRRYLRWLEVGDCFSSFREFLKYESRHKD